MKYQVRTYAVDGLHLGKKRFLCKNLFMLTDSKKNGDSNIATAHVVLERPIPTFKKSEQFLIQLAIDDAEAIHLLAIFLACFHLSTNNHMPKIVGSQSGGYPLDDLAKLGDEYGFLHIDFESKKPIKSVESNLKSLNFSLPLFEKVMKSIKFKQKRPKNPLSIALPIYQRVADNLDFAGIVDMVTILESLISDGENELRYKFALRSSLLIEKNPKKRGELFKFLSRCYSLRSNLVHGTEISLANFSKDQIEIILNLQGILKIALKKYIELIDSGLTKEQIIIKLDNKALGVP